MSESHISQVLFEHSYKIERDDGDLVITDQDNSSIISIIIWLVGIGLLISGVIVNIVYLFIGLFFIAYSIRKEYYKLPKQVVLSRKNARIELYYDLLGKKEIPLKVIQEIAAQRYEETNFDNPFQAGSRKHSYDFVLKLANGKEKRMIKLDFIKPCDEDMKEFAFMLNQLISKN